MASKQPITEDDKIVGWKAYVEMGVNPATGKRRRTVKNFRFDKGYTKKDAEIWIADQITKREKGEYIETKDILLKNYIINWLKSEKKPHIATTTYNNYLNRIKAYIIPKLGQIPVQKLEAYHLSQFFSYLREEGAIKSDGGLSENTMKKIYIVLNMALRKAVKFGIIRHNPLEAIDSPQPEPYNPPVMNVEEIKKLLTAAKESKINDYNKIFMYTYIFFAFTTGMRKSEMLGLEWEDIDMENKVAKVHQRLIADQYGEEGEKIRHEQQTKSKSSKRNIKLPDELIIRLKKFKSVQSQIKIKYPETYYKEKSFVFCREDGRFIHPTSINKKFNYLIKKAGLSPAYTVHTLRHTFATVSVDNNIKLPILKDILGHSTVATTIDLYVHPDIESQSENTKKMDELMTGI